MFYVLKRTSKKKPKERKKKEVKNVPKNKFDIWFTIKHFK